MERDHILTQKSVKTRLSKIVGVLHVKESLKISLVFMGYFFLLLLYQNLNGKSIENFSVSHAQMLYLAATPVFSALIGMISAWKAGILIPSCTYLFLHFLFVKTSRFENGNFAFGALCVLIFFLAVLVTKILIFAIKKVREKREKERGA